jgi:hypothetical protein
LTGQPGDGPPRLLPTPIAGDTAPERHRQLGGTRPSGSKRQAGLIDVIAVCLAPVPPGGRGRLLPTPDTGTSPRGHGRRGGRPGNGHQSGASIDAAARDAARPGSRWSEYLPAIRRWERVLGCPAPPPAQPGPGGRPWLSAEFAEWMMGIPGVVTRVPGIARTHQLRIIGNGVVPQQAAAALRLLIAAAAIPVPPDGGTRAAA